MDKSYTRAELKELGEDWPIKGVRCERCNTVIPNLRDLEPSDENHIRELIESGNRVSATKELIKRTGCGHRTAKIWVAHPDGPKLKLIGPPCPKCDKPLRTHKVKQCPHCFHSWHT